MFDPNIQTPYVQSFSVGLQRSLGRDTAIEVRYVGNRNHHRLDDRGLERGDPVRERVHQRVPRRAGQPRGARRAGLRRGRQPCTFAYRGAGTGTAPLPIYLAYFQGLNASRATDATAYSSANFRSTAWTGHLGYYEPDPDDAANDLHANLTFRGNAINAGLAPNFFEMNPAVTAGQHHPLARGHALSLDADRAAAPARQRAAW